MRPCGVLQEVWTESRFSGFTESLFVTTSLWQKPEPPLSVGTVGALPNCFKSLNMISWLWALYKYSRSQNPCPSAPQVWCPLLRAGRRCMDCFDSLLLVKVDMFTDQGCLFPLLSEKVWCLKKRNYLSSWISSLSFVYRFIFQLYYWSLICMLYQLLRMKSYTVLNQCS